MWLATFALFSLVIYYLIPFLLDIDEKYYRSKFRLGAIRTKNRWYDKIPEGKYSKVRYHRRFIPSDIDVIVIGSGMGSLTTAALLSMSGKRVLVLEQHDVAGGTLHTFEDMGVEFETGLHYVGNIAKRKPIYDLITGGRVNWCQMGENNTYDGKVYDEIAIDGTKFQLPAGKDNLIRYLVNIFPEEKEGIEKFINLVCLVAKRDLFFKLKSTHYSWLNRWIKYIDPLYYKYLNKTAQEVVDSCVCAPLLKCVLLGQFGDYGIKPSEAPFFLHASIMNHYLEGGWYPEGGSAKLAEEICRTIWDCGGAVLVGKKVSKLLEDDGLFEEDQEKSSLLSWLKTKMNLNQSKKNSIIGVQMENTQKLFADKIISGIGVRATFTKLLEDSQYHKLLKKIPASVQHLYCFISLKGTPTELKLQDSNLWVYPDADFEKLMLEYYEEPVENKMPLFIGSSSAKDKSWTERFPERSNLVILAPFPKSYVEEWQNERCGKRNIDYRLLKTELAQKMIQEGIKKYYPHLLGNIVNYSMGTPLTTQHYLGSLEGESYGLLASKRRFLETELLNPKTQWENFYLTGQDICTLGVTGAMMGGILTANHILGYGGLTDIILGNNVVEDLIKKFRKRV